MRRPRAGDGVDGHAGGRVEAAKSLLQFVVVHGASFVRVSNRCVSGTRHRIFPVPPHVASAESLLGPVHTDGRRVGGDVEHDRDLPRLQLLPRPQAHDLAVVGGEFGERGLRARRRPRPAPRRPVDCGARPSAGRRAPRGGGRRADGSPGSVGRRRSSTAAPARRARRRAGATAPATRRRPRRRRSCRVDASTGVAPAAARTPRGTRPRSGASAGRRRRCGRHGSCEVHVRHAPRSFQTIVHQFDAVQLVQLAR